MAMIVVTGATGNIGSLVVRELRARGIEFRAFVRDGAKVRGLFGPDIVFEVVEGDFGDPASIEKAVTGAKAVVVSSANDPRQAEHEAAIVDAVVATGGARVVKLSTIGAELGSPAAFLDWHGRAEKHLARSGLPAVVLRSSFYMSNLFAAAEEIAQAGQLVAPAGQARIAMIDPRDVAAVAVEALTSPAHDGETYELTGPVALTYEQAAATLSQALGRDIRYVEVSDDAARQGLLAAGLPEWMANGLVGVFSQLRDGLAAGVTHAVQALTGREPRTLAEFIGDHASVFGATQREAGTEPTMSPSRVRGARGGEIPNTDQAAAWDGD